MRELYFILKTFVCWHQFYPQSKNLTKTLEKLVKTIYNVR